MTVFTKTQVPSGVMFFMTQAPSTAQKATVTMTKANAGVIL
ncbi:MAG: hypothetical protein ACI9FJ_002795 [Alteromonadaceae bacterium]|jgi:hypothetical protein